ncbi:MAG: LPS export ABC transporter periplasmic protein LptC [Candidatus Omnitrophica bacterium]|nr:LPS export ABC transporter periplasmic protein LptC [Candidatus Omnitrophota bacterium]
MMFKRLTFIITVILGTSILYAEENVKPAAENVSIGTTSPESDQQISEFSLAGYGEKGKKTWDLAGKSADIFDDVVKLKSIEGNLYGKDNVNLTADKGDFNKTEGKVHLEENVVIKTASGAELTTNSLDWDRKKQLVSTAEPVNIQKENMITTGVGIKGEPELNKITLEKEVKVEIAPDAAAKEKNPNSPSTIITCDGPLDVDYEKNIALFQKNVKVLRQDLEIYSDTMEVYFQKSGEAEKEAGASASIMGNKINKIFAKGNVKIVRGENLSYSDEATYNAIDKKITLTGSPKLFIYSTEDFNALAGD